MSSTLSGAFEQHPDLVMLKHKYVDFNSLRTLPDSHDWAQLSDCIITDHDATNLVPIIDLCDDGALGHIGMACRSGGVFHVTGHGIPPSVFHDVENAVRTLFSLPIQQKLKAARSPDGFSGYGYARISSSFSKCLWSEGFTVIGSPLEHFRQLWPHDHIKFCGMIEEYAEEMRKLARRLMWMMLGSLAITEVDVKWGGAKEEEALSALQLNFYPSCPEPDRAMGLAPHTDSTLLTILYQSKNATGLQIMREGIGWVPVPPIPGGLVVNIGDLLHILSNGYFPSVLHRAVVNRNINRLSLAFLYGPPETVQVAPVSKLVGPMRPSLYRPITWKEYLAAKEKYFHQALSSVKLHSLEEISTI